MIIRWIASNLSSNGQPLPIAFTGSVWTYIGWQVLMVISFITIIGWAWVVTAWMRWICRNISGTRREIIFNASGLEVLWRTIVLVIACAFIIPIPWVMRWYAAGTCRNSRWPSTAPTPRVTTSHAPRERIHLRSRTEPSCATEATSVPSGLKIRPRVKPRPSCALGESCA